MKKELLSGLTEEQIEKASKCKSSEELLALAKAEGVKLNEEQLNAVSGGVCQTMAPRRSICPACGVEVEGEFVETTPGDGKYHFICGACGHQWTEK